MPELSNVYRPDRSMVQTVPGAGNPTAAAVLQSSAYGLDPNLLARLIAARQAQRQPSQAVRSYEQGLPQSRGDMDEAFTQFMPDPTPKRAEGAPTRMRRVRTRSAVPIFGMDEAGVTYNDVQEHMLPGGGWSGDALYGSLEGNEAAARQRMAVIDRTAAGPASIADPVQPFPLQRESEHDRNAAILRRAGAR